MESAIGSDAQIGGPSRVFVRKESFDDVVSMCGCADGWEQDYKFFGGRPFRGRVIDLWIDDLQIYVEHTEGSLFVSGVTWKDALFLAAPLLEGPPATINGVTVNVGDAFVGLGGPEWHIRTAGRWSVLTIAFNRTRLTEDDLPASLLVEAGAGVVLPGLLDSDFLAAVAGGANLLAEGSLGGVVPGLPMQLSQIIKERTLDALRRTSTSRYPRNQYRSAAAAAIALTNLRSAALSDVKTADVLRTKPASYRTLHNHVLRLAGCSPNRFVELLKLNAAHDAIAMDGLAALDAAAAVGLWHGGRFAKRYYELFGELPSQTRRRATTRLA